jgi:hypothetical protein
MCVSSEGWSTARQLYELPAMSIPERAPFERRCCVSYTMARVPPVRAFRLSRVAITQAATSEESELGRAALEDVLMWFHNR